MITRLYANNFRCLVAFKADFDSFGVLCGPNGAGKSSVFDALTLIRNLASGGGYLGGDAERDVRHLEFTNWQKGTAQESTIQQSELGVTADGHSFEYVLHIEQKANHEKPRIVKESATCDKKSLFERDLEGVRFKKTDGTQTGFPLDWRQAALASIQPEGSLDEMSILQEAISKLLILRPNPRGMEKESKAESKHPDLHPNNLTSWYRSLAKDQETTDALRDLLRDVWPDFRSFKLEDVGMNTKALQLRFESLDGPDLRRDSFRTGARAEFDPGVLFFEQLSDGEKALVGLYMLRAALATSARLRSLAWS